jgi:hypothetical protein
MRRRPVDEIPGVDPVMASQIELIEVSPPAVGCRLAPRLEIQTLTATTLGGWSGLSSSTSICSGDAPMKSLASAKSCPIGIRPGRIELDSSAACCKAANWAPNSAMVEIGSDADGMLGSFPFTPKYGADEQLPD